MKKLIQHWWVASRTNPDITYDIREYQCLDEMGCLHFESEYTCPEFKFRGYCKHLSILDRAFDNQVEERRY